MENKKQSLIRTKQILGIFAVVLAVLAIAMMGVASAKSVYVLADINAGSTPVMAYDLQGNQLVYQATNYAPYHGIGGVDISIDTDSKTLFITYENSNTIELVDAETFANYGSTTASGASNLAGIVIDQETSLVYTMDRTTSNLYIYTYDSSTHLLSLQTQRTLSEVSGAWGLVLDEKNDRLYVADGGPWWVYNNEVEVYNLNPWSHEKTITISSLPIVVGIAMDYNNGYLYAGAGVFDTFVTNADRLVKYDLNSDSETYITLEFS